MASMIDFDFVDLMKEFRNNTFIRSSSFIENSSNIFGNKKSYYTSIGNEIFLHVMNFSVDSSYEIRVHRRDFVCFQIMISGKYKRSSSNYLETIDNSYMNISNSPISESYTDGGQKLRGIYIAIRREFLIDYFKLNLAMMPERFRSIFASPLGFSQSLRLVPQASIQDATEQIITCQLDDPLRAIFIQSKVMEIVCRVLSQVLSNSLLVGGSRTSHERAVSQIIEIAASIYRREIQKPPTIEQLSERVGLNRNDLTAGFRSAFGLTPHSFSREIRLRRARELLETGEVSISEVARRVGYEGYASLSRAYVQYFGIPPVRNIPRD